MKGGESKVLAKAQIGGKMERMRLNVNGITATFNKTRVDRIPMDIRTSFDAQIAVSNLFDFNKEGFTKRSILCKEDSSG